VLTYVAIIYWLVAMMLELHWALTLITFAGLLANVVLNLALIRPSLRYFGPGGGGGGCALAMLGTEIVVTSLMMLLVGREAFDRRSLGTFAKSLLAYGVVVLLNRVLAFLGPPRLIVDAAVYVAIVISTGALRVTDMFAIIRQAARNRSQGDRPAE